jgi:hypothetical protein
MAKLTLEISDEVVARLRSQLSIKAMVGNLYGLEDALVVKMVEAIEKKMESVKIEFKDKTK